MLLRRTTMIAIVAGAATAAAAGIAFAGQGGTPSAQALSAPASATPVFRSLASEDAPPVSRLDEMLTGVAERLGVTEQELREAFKAEALEQLDAAVAEGKLTEEQALRLRERIEAGPVPLPGPGQMRSHVGQRGMHGIMPPGLIEEASSYLGIEEAQLLSELRAGASLAEVAESRGKSSESLVNLLVSDMKEKLEQAVEVGRLDQKRAERMLERAERMLEELVENGFPRQGSNPTPDR